MKKITIRRAKVSDAKAVAMLLGGLGKEFRVTPHRAARRLRRTSDDIFLAASNGEPVGLVAVNSCQSIHADSRHGRIMTLVARKDRKRSGVGRAMMRFALSHLRKLGCRKIELTSRVYRGGAHRFYRAMGFKPTSIRFSRMVS